MKMLLRNMSQSSRDKYSSSIHKTFGYYHVSIRRKGRLRSVSKNPLQPRSLRHTIGEEKHSLAGSFEISSCQVVKIRFSILVHILFPIRSSAVPPPLGKVRHIKPRAHLNCTKARPFTPLHPRYALRPL